MELDLVSWIFVRSSLSLAIVGASSFPGLDREGAAHFYDECFAGERVYVSQGF